MGFDISNPLALAKTIRTLAETGCDSIGPRLHVDVSRHPTTICLEWSETGPYKPLIAGFTLTEQPNCCGALISTRTFVSEKHQKQGIAQAMMPLKEMIAREFGHSCLVATVNITGNPAEAHILEKFGWVQGYRFNNLRTKNDVGFFFKNLR